MLLSIPDVLTKEQVAQAREILEKAESIDGKVTAGHQSAPARNNMQILENSRLFRRRGARISSFFWI
jgi:PKHD-type hydroxylase